MWDLYCESFTTVVGMGVGVAPNDTRASRIADACGINVSAELWFLFGDLEREWVRIMNERSEKKEE